LGLGGRQSYAAAAVVYAVATTIVVVAEPTAHEALFICYMPATVLGYLLGGIYSALAIAFGGGVTITVWIYPLVRAGDALALTLYVDAAVVVLLSLDLLNQKYNALAAERDRAKLLLREAQHRTANNLMFVSAFLRAERRRVRENPALAQAAVEEAMRRLEIFSRVHRLLSEPDQLLASPQRLFRALCEGIIEASGAKNVSVNLEIEQVELQFEYLAVLALILAEIVTNALKHAFADGEDGQIVVLLAAQGGLVTFEVRDNGPGFGSRGLDGRAALGAGHGILEMLAAQLGGRLTLTSEDGLRTRIVFPNAKRLGSPSISDLMPGGRQVGA
jgi:two-component sensor histidine kinase